MGRALARSWSGGVLMFVLPLFATLISLACALIAGRRFALRRRRHEGYWAVAFGFFALGAAAATLGYLAGWNPLLVRVFYASGAILTTAYLGLGSLALLGARWLERWGAPLLLFITALAFAFVFNTPVDAARLGDAWYALDTAGSPTRALALLTNIGGSLLVIGGALYSVSLGLPRGMPRRRAAGVLLIALGTLVVASGSTLVRLAGNSAYLFAAMTPGVAIIMGGYLLANRAATPATAPSQSPPLTMTPVEPPHPATPVAATAPSAPDTPVTAPPPASASGYPPAIPAVRSLGPADAAALRDLLVAPCSPAPLALAAPFLPESALRAALEQAAAPWFGVGTPDSLLAALRVVVGDSTATRHTATLDLFAVHATHTSVLAVAALLDHALDYADQHLGLVRLECALWPGDSALLRLLQSRGFVVEGAQRAARFTGGAHRDILIVARVNTAAPGRGG